mmetsp:Transcript_6617/g.11639  ORF Transcript_6617/g.11639 Transcript_6617/m.11639 type:complete len:301 (-) Transcript_6617:8-910(-)
MRCLSTLNMKAPEIVMLDDSSDSTSEAEAQAEAIVNADDTWKIIYPAKNKSNQVSITSKDYSRLSPGEYLNDSLIDFYLRLLTDEKARSRHAYAFNSFFYSVLKDSGFDGVRNWTKKIDIFSYHHILVPINENEHWTLAILMQAHTLMSKKQKAAWLYFDSLGGSGQEAIDILREYIRVEWEAARGTEIDMDESSIPMFQPDVPLQDNLTDCGVFLLHYAELFLKNPNQFNIKHLDSVTSTQFFKHNWFELEDIARKRLEVKVAILNLHCGGPFREGVNLVFKKCWIKRRIRKVPKRYLI